MFLKEYYNTCLNNTVVIQGMYNFRFVDVKFGTTCYKNINVGRYMDTYVGYSESKYRLLISLAHPRDCHFAHVQ